MHFKRQKAHIRENTKCNQKAERHTAIVLTPKKCNRFDKSSTSAGTLWNPQCGLWKTLQGCFILGSLILDASLPNLTIQYSAKNFLS